jgi:hypothetical protein
MGLTAEFLFSFSTATECAQSSYELLEVDCSSTTAHAHQHSFIPRTPSPHTSLPPPPSPPTRRVRTHSSSKMAIIRLDNGLLAMAGICKNSSLSIEPFPSLSSFMKRFLSLWISAAETMCTIPCQSNAGTGRGEVREGMGTYSLSSSASLPRWMTGLLPSWLVWAILVSTRTED